MNNVWRGAVIGAIAGAAAGLGLDRRTADASPEPGRVVGDATSVLSSLGQGLAQVSEHMHDSRIPKVVAHTTEVVTRKVRDLPTDRDAGDMVRAGAAKAAQISTDVSGSIITGLSGS